MADQRLREGERATGVAPADELPQQTYGDRICPPLCLRPAHSLPSLI